MKGRGEERRGEDEIGMRRRRVRRGVYERGKE